jgi:hypothetical protein
MTLGFWKFSARTAAGAAIAGGLGREAQLPDLLQGGRAVTISKFGTPSEGKGSASHV